MAPKDSHKWTPEQTRKLLRFRMVNEEIFLKSKHSAKTQWEEFLSGNGLTGKVTAQQASKKWENLKKQYMDLKLVKSGSRTDAGEQTAANWQYFEEMHEVLGSRPSIDPPVVVASFQEDPTAVLMEIVEPSSTSGASCAAVSDSEFPQPPANSGSASASRGPPPATPSPRKRKSNDLLDFLKEESAKEQKRHEESEAKTDRLLGLFEKMVEKM